LLHPNAVTESQWGMGYEKMCIFWLKSPFVSEMVWDRSLVTLISNWQSLVAGQSVSFSMIVSDIERRDARGPIFLSYLSISNVCILVPIDQQRSNLVVNPARRWEYFWGRRLDVPQTLGRAPPLPNFSTPLTCTSTLRPRATKFGKVTHLEKGCVCMESTMP